MSSYQPAQDRHAEVDRPRPVDAKNSGRAGSLLFGLRSRQNRLDGSLPLKQRN